MSEDTEAKTKKVVKKVEEKKPNIENLAALKKEFVEGNRDARGHRIPMPDRKLVALRQKLVSLFHSKAITEEEQELMEAILRKDRSLGRIATSDEYLLNKIESERCDQVCIVKSENTPVVHHLSQHLECKFKYDPEYNDGKNKPDSIGRYYVYVPRTIPTDHQLKNATVRKENLGHPTDPSEYPEPKVLIHRLGLRQREFDAWFEIDQDYLSMEGAAVKEAEYTF